MSFPLLRSLAWVTTGLAGIATALAAAERPPASPRPVAVSEKDNPRVEPGLVRWHATFADAQAAGQKSGKPVLLFHMMGQLDRQFC